MRGKTKSSLTRGYDEKQENKNKESSVEKGGGGTQNEITVQQGEGDFVQATLHPASFSRDAAQARPGNYMKICLVG